MIIKKAFRIFLSHDIQRHGLACAVAQWLEENGHTCFLDNSRELPLAGQSDPSAGAVILSADVSADRTLNLRTETLSRSELGDLRSHRLSLNIAYLAPEIERSDILLLISNGDFSQIESPHVRGEIFYANFISRQRGRQPVIVSISPDTLSTLIFEDDIASLLHHLNRCSKRRVYISVQSTYWLALSSVATVVLYCALRYEHEKISTSLISSVIIVACVSRLASKKAIDWARSTFLGAASPTRPSILAIGLVQWVLLPGLTLTMVIYHL